MMYTMPKNLLSICVNFTLATQLFSGTNPLGHANCAGGSLLTGGSFSAPAERGT